MATAQPVSRDPALEAHALWYKFRGEIAAVVVVVILGIIALGVYKLYTDRRDSSAADLLAAAKNAPDYEQVIAQYPNTPAGASAHLLLAEAQRKDRKLVESNATLQVFIDKNPKHELVSTAEIGIASNLEAMGKTDEALSSYQQIAAKYPTSFTAPLALISQVPLLKAKSQTDAARRVCETILTQYRESFWAGEAMRELRSLKPAGGAQATGIPGPKPPLSLPSAPRPPMMLPPAPAPAPSGALAAPAKPK
jgi:predicted negative regulator of RcsB-dependent stress response